MKYGEAGRNRPASPLISNKYDVFITYQYMVYKLEIIYHKC